jgi:hypothetical protein
MAACHDGIGPRNRLVGRKVNASEMDLCSSSELNGLVGQCLDLHLEAPFISNEIIKMAVLVIDLTSSWKVFVKGCHFGRVVDQ